MVKSKELRARGGAVIVVVGAVLLLSLQVNGCVLAQPQKASNGDPTASPSRAGVGTASPSAVSVQVAEAQRGTLDSALTYSGDVRPKAQVNVSTKMVGRIEELSVDVGSTVRAGQTVGRLDSASLQAQLKQAEAALTMAQAKLAQMEAGPRRETVAQVEANLDSAREKLSAMEEGSRAETVAQAEAALRLAEARLAQLRNGPTPEQLEQAEAALRAARNQLYAAQAQADAYLGSRGVAMGALIFTPEMKEAQSGMAYEQVKVAEARLAELKAGPTREQLEQAQAGVDQAKAALEIARSPFTAHDLKQVENAVAAAEEQLKLAKNPFTKSDFDVVEASVAQAQANVDFVKSQLAETSIIAPMDGIVSDKFLSVGALAAPQVPILTIISSELEIALSVEEARSGQVRLGQAVSINVAAQPDESFVGAVSSVAPAIDPRSRTFTIKVSLKDGDGKLKAGMFAKVNLNLEQRQGVLSVPEQAVAKHGTDNVVYVVDNGKAGIRKVDLGASDSQRIEIKSGLEPGEKVVLNHAGLKDGDPVVVK